MKHKILLFLAILLVFANILYLLAAHYYPRLDYEVPLMMLNGAFSLYTSAAFLQASQNSFSFHDKLPLPVALEAEALQLSDRILIQSSPDFLCLKDKNGRWLSASPAYLASFNLAGVDYLGKTYFELAQQADCDIEALKAGAARDKIAWKLRRPVKEIRRISPEVTMEVTRTPVYDLEQKRYRLIVTGIPAGEYERKRARLELLEQAVDQCHIACALLDQQFQVLDSNKTFQELTGYPPDALHNQNIAMIIAPAESERAMSALETACGGNAGQRWTAECNCRRGDGGVFPARLEVTAVKDGSRDNHFFFSLSDITQQKLAENRVQKIVYFDELTGLANRALFFERLGQFLSTAARYHLHVIVLYINLDRFKSINDSLGHAAGDELLKKTAERLTDITRKSDLVARLSGDEFAVLLLNDKLQEHAVYAASMIAKKITGCFAQSFFIRRRDVYVGASIGIAISPEDGASAEALVKHADMAMHEAKNAGRNHYQFYRKDFTAAIQDRLNMEINLRNAIAKNELQLYFQPQYRAKDRVLCGAEVLIRWFHQVDGQIKMVPPNHFIPVAEESGLIVDIGRWILRTACKQLKTWQQEGIPLPQVSVNISARQFSDPDFLEMVENALGDSELAPEHLELEITESMLVGDIKRIELQLKRLKKMGIHLALDDFGTGYSSLSYLKNFPIDVLKIDQSFIREMTNDSRDANIVRAIIEMGHSLGQKIIAEGVETEKQLGYLVGRECDIIQGYFFSPPLPGHKMTDLLCSERKNIGKPKQKSLIN
ncbi:putative bifunctional diguanylate cyclase/phosphodiesterase [Methylomicrobium lacus]|uniref:putative bifunctional diguanylate cyclase/phosphodiesterase n=1 Tax=Methylomicrobium lacus TaxID=136992 RepID=UPI0035A83E56